MKRREILRYTAYVTGAALSAPLMGTILSGCKTDPAVPVESGLNYFNNKDFNLVKELVDVILPKSDSPSASDVGVHETIDQMIGLVYTEDQKASYGNGWEELKTYLQTGSDTLSSFLNLEKGGSNEDVRKAYMDLKQQTVAYYLNTEEVATNFLNYLPVPGEYQSCISLDEVDGKAWAL